MYKPSSSFFHNFTNFVISDSHSITSQNLNIVDQVKGEPKVKGKPKFVFAFSFGNPKLKRFSSGKDSIYYHSFRGTNVCLARLQMELCRAANIFAAR